LDMFLKTTRNEKKGIALGLRRGFRTGTRLTKRKKERGS